MEFDAPLYTPWTICKLDMCKNKYEKSNIEKFLKENAKEDRFA